MINESSYFESVKNCQVRLNLKIVLLLIICQFEKWNSKSVASRLKSSIAIFDHQTGIVQRPIDGLYRSRLERCVPSNAMQIVAYPAKRYFRSRTIPTEACEFKHFRITNPALDEAINAIENPPWRDSGLMMAAPSAAEASEHQGTPTRQMHSNSRTGTYVSGEFPFSISFNATSISARV